MRDPIPGDLVKKVHGDFDCDKIGVVIECQTNIVGCLLYTSDAADE